MTVPKMVSEAVAREAILKERRLHEITLKQVRIASLTGEIAQLESEIQVLLTENNKADTDMTELEDRVPELKAAKPVA